ncbi:MAG: PEP-CTERM sorting domain-containing protein [Pirellulales bacterium]|nr:PEP-CTERM sorting domain-containing protein [Pirellulales bacterium]
MDFNSTLNLAITTDGVNPPGTGNYLDVTAGATGSSQGVGIGRSYTDGMDVSVSHSIDFKYRINEDLGASGTFTHYNDRYQMFDVGENRKTANGYCSWVIGCYGAGGTTWLDAEDAKYWVVYDGDNDTGSFVAERQVNSGILVQTGVTYDFHIDVDAATKTWDVTIGTGGTTLYDSTVLHPDGLGWRTNAATVAGRLGYGCYTNASTDTRAYSLDGIRIVPEPSALLLLLSSVLFLSVSARRSR